MLLKKDLFVLVDYGVGMNLSQKILHAKVGDKYQLGLFGIAGTKMFLDPILKKQYLEIRLDSEADYDYEMFDIFKADIYSLGLTFVECLIKMDIEYLNESAEMFYEVSQKLNEI